MLGLQAREEAADSHDSRCLQACTIHHLLGGALHGSLTASSFEGLPQHAALHF